MTWEEYIRENPDKVRGLDLPHKVQEARRRTLQPKNTEPKNMAKRGRNLGGILGRRHKHKFGAVKTERDGFKFDSKLEARYYDYLQRQKEERHVLFFLRQVPFHLEGNVTYRCDFLVFYSGGTVRIIDVKGRETKEFIRAKKQVEARYPVEIEVVKDGEF